MPPGVGLVLDHRGVARLVQVASQVQGRVGQLQPPPAAGCRRRIRNPAATGSAARSRARGCRPAPGIADQVRRAPDHGAAAPGPAPESRDRPRVQRAGGVQPSAIRIPRYPRAIARKSPRPVSVPSPIAGTRNRVAAVRSPIGRCEARHQQIRDDHDQPDDADEDHRVPSLGSIGEPAFCMCSMPGGHSVDIAHVPGLVAAGGMQAEREGEKPQMAQLHPQHRGASRHPTSAHGDAEPPDQTDQQPAKAEVASVGRQGSQGHAGQGHGDHRRRRRQRSVALISPPCSTARGPTRPRPHRCPA